MTKLDTEGIALRYGAPFGLIVSLIWIPAECRENTSPTTGGPTAGSSEPTAGPNRHPRQAVGQGGGLGESLAEWPPLARSQERRPGAEATTTAGP